MKLKNIDKTRLEFYKLQLQEKNSVVKSTMDLLVRWYTFFCSVSIVAISATIIEFENSWIALAVVKVFFWVTIVSVGTPLWGIGLFVKYHNDIKETTNRVNKILNEDVVSPPVLKLVPVAVCGGMFVSLLALLVFWYYIQFEMISLG
ncbi:MAG: hypothetical protein K9J17_02460 [Flavobacteriales bacterium]|nr:hypothetical protein [Flavobacteriales bacterium]